MKYVGIVFRKEIYRVFSDKKMIFGLFILPVLMLVLVYSLVGFLAASMLKDQAKHEPTLSVYGAPESFTAFVKTYKNTDADAPANTYRIDSSDYHIAFHDDLSDLESEKQMIYDGDLDIIVVFPEDFDKSVASYSNGDEIPDIQTFYNPSEDYSKNAKGQIHDVLLSDYRKKLQEERFGELDRLKIFTLDAKNEHAVIQNDNKAQGKLLGVIIPYIITILLFSSVMSLGTDTFTGEKERGTMAALLMTPIPRTAIVYGKLFALMALSGISALVYGGAMIFAMPLMYRTLGEMTGQNLSFSVGQMFMLLTIIVSIVFVYVTIVSVAGTFASKMQESANYIMPAYMAVMAVGMISIFQGDKIKLMQYLIPLFGPTLALKNIFTQDITVPGYLLALLSNIVVGASLAYVTSRMFKNERIMFNA